MFILVGGDLLCVLSSPIVSHWSGQVCLLCSTLVQGVFYWPLVAKAVDDLCWSGVFVLVCTDGPACLCWCAVVLWPGLMWLWWCAVVLSSGSGLLQHMPI